MLDSVAALTPKAELEGDMGDANIGLQARLNNIGLLNGDIKVNIPCEPIEYRVYA